MKKAKVIAVFNQKGGVGKSTTVVNTGACLAEMGKKTLIIDNDPQCNSTANLGHGQTEPSVIDCYMNFQSHKMGASPVLKTAHDGLDLINGNTLLGEIERLFSDVEHNYMALTKELEYHKQNYDYILIDCNPNIGILSINALAAADLVIIPYDCGYYSTQGLSTIKEFIEEIKSSGINPKLEYKILMTLIKTNYQMQMAEIVKEQFEHYKTIVRYSETIKTAQNKCLPINKHDRRHNGFKDYMQLAKEITHDNSKKPITRNSETR